MLGMGSGGSALSDIWAIQQNPSGVAGLGRSTFAISYEKWNSGDDLSRQTMLIGVPLKQMVLAASLERYGIKEYLELRTGIYAAREFGDNFRLGLGLKYHQLDIIQYGSAAAFSVEAGFQFELSDRITVGSHLRNPGFSGFNDSGNSKLPVTLAVGGAFELNSRVTIVGDLNKALKAPVDFQTGIEYIIMKSAALRGGLSLNPLRQYAGFGLNYSRIRIDASASNHQALGFSPQISLGYEF